jgi:hypothetical protein
MTTVLTDTRRAMRDALHRLVRGADDWAQPSLDVFRNRLLDEVGSDARPLANVLMEAIERGVLYTLPRTKLDPAQWSAKSAPLVNSWIADRFLQPEVARWAIEAWGYAFGCIEASQLTAFVDQPKPPAPSWNPTANTSVGSAYALPPLPPARTPSRGGAFSAPPSTGNVWRGGARVPAPPLVGGRALPRAIPGSRIGPPRGGSSNWAITAAPNVAKITALIAVAAYISIFYQAAGRSRLAAQREAARVASRDAAIDRAIARDPKTVRVVASPDSLAAPDLTMLNDSAPEIPTVYTVTDGRRVAAPTASAAQSTGATDGIGVGGQATRVPLAPGTSNAPSLAMTRLPAEGATGNAYLELAARSNVRGLGASTSPSGAASPGTGLPGSGTLGTATPASPGVPGITRNALPLRDGEESRVRRVQPATRPTPRLNASAPAAAPSGRIPAPATTGGAQRVLPGLDQVLLESGRRLQGRVEVIKTSSVVFRDAETGLRYEFPKDDIDRITTEFGNQVRFKQAGSGAARSATDRRQSTVGGVYTVRYDAARVNGSAACRDLWRGPSGTDAARVSHRAGDDTLSVSFTGGDSFPSVIDADGFFSSTFRVMPGQAELATALTTRLNGRFNADGTLAMQVNVIGYRRVQGTSGVACHIIVYATGTRR